ncbi:MAG TPA: enoyl-CoA hydratase-related protein [Acidimicrobiales bacterium]
MIHLTSDGAVSTIAIDRPKRRNAVDGEALDGLFEAIGSVAPAGDGRCRAMVLTGSGGHFCAGADLSTLEDIAFATRLRQVLFAIRDLPIPVIAAVGGAALGAGTQLAAVCDLRVAAPDATFGIPANRLGVAVDHWTIQRLTLDWGFGPARAMLVGGQTFTGEDAQRVGFVHRIATDPLAAAQEWAGELAQRAPLTMATHKLGLARLEREVGTDPPFQRAWRQVWASADVAEGVAAFGEKRPPRFEGR